MRYAGGSPAPVWGNSPNSSGVFTAGAGAGTTPPTTAPTAPGSFVNQWQARTAALQQAADAGVETSGAAGGWNPEPGLNQTPETQALLAQQAQNAALLQQLQGTGATTATAATTTTTATGFSGWVETNPWLAAGLGVGIIALIWAFTRSGRR